MSLLRKDSLEQLKRINKEIKKQKGDINKKSKYEDKFPNALWIDNPIESDEKNIRKIATIDEIIPLETTKKEKSKKSKKTNEVLSFKNFLDKYKL